MADKSKCYYCKTVIPDEATVILSNTQNRMCPACAAKWPSKVWSQKTTGYSYMQELINSIGVINPVLAELVSMISYYKQKAINGQGILYDWGEGIKEAQFVITYEDCKKYPHFKHLWGHKIYLVIEDDKLIDHRFDETDFLGDITHD